MKGATGLANISPPRPVEVAGEDRHHVGQPGGQRPELLGAQADASVDGGRASTAHLVGQAPDGVGRDGAHRRHPLRGKAHGHCLELVDASDDVSDVAEIVGERT